MSTALDLIAQVAPDFGGTCVISVPQTATLDLPIRLVDGRTLPYKLHLRQDGEWIEARESTTHHLPGFCPERHINYDGTFCLFYAGANPLPVSDEPSARAWLETIYKYLKLQERARTLRRWPNGSAWAHGDAARHQLRAQKAASAISGKIANDLAVNQLGLKRRKSKERPILDVISGTVPLFSVWEKPQRVINQKRRCFCGLYGRRRPKRIRRCHDHARQATELAFALRDREEAERQYWDSMHGKPCCGSCDSCPLSP